MLIKTNHTYFIIHLGSKHSQPTPSNGANNLLGSDRSKASDTNIDLENSMDHLINPIIDYDDPIFYKQPSDAFVIKNQPATLHCRVSHALDVHFKVLMKTGETKFTMFFKVWQFLTKVSFAKKCHNTAHRQDMNVC